jgi:hypothetical protein
MVRGTAIDTKALRDLGPRSARRNCSPNFLERAPEAVSAAVLLLCQLKSDLTHLEAIRLSDACRIQPSSPELHH